MPSHPLQINTAPKIFLDVTRCARWWRIFSSSCLSCPILHILLLLKNNKKQDGQDRQDNKFAMPSYAIFRVFLLAAESVKKFYQNLILSLSEFYTSVV